MNDHWRIPFVVFILGGILLAGLLGGFMSALMAYLIVGMLIYLPILEKNVSAWVIPLWLPAMFSNKLSDWLTEDYE